MLIGIGEIILLLILVAGGFAGAFFLVKRLTDASGKTCPYCAERIKEAAKICRYCHMDVDNVEIENKPPKGFFQ
jgi:uncharacterized membrane protein